MAALLAGSAGCVENESLFLLHPEGAPEVIASFVTVRVPPDYEVLPVTEEFLAGVALTYGSYPDINGGEPVTTGATTVTTRSAIRVIFDELLDGQSIEQFKCACWDPVGATLAASRAGCGTGPFFSDSTDPAACTGCPDNPATTGENEADRCEDANFDGVPDDAVLKAGVASVTCDNATFGTRANDDDVINAAWNNNIETDGLYDPSGSLAFPASLSLIGRQPVDGLGPAFRWIPQTNWYWPTSSNCSLTMGTTVTDKDGTAVPTTHVIPFTTDAPLLTATTVTHGRTGVSGAAGTGGVTNFDITFNTAMHSGTMTGATFATPAPTADDLTRLGGITLVCTGGTGGGTPGPARYPAIAAAAAPFSGANRNVIRIQTMGGYGFNKTCTLTIPDTFNDVWGNAVQVLVSGAPAPLDLQPMTAGNQRTLTFQTGNPPMMTKN